MFVGMHQWRNWEPWVYNKKVNSATGLHTYTTVCLCEPESILMVKQVWQALFTFVDILYFADDHPYKNIEYSLYVNHEQHANNCHSFSAICILFDYKALNANCAYSVHMSPLAVITLYTKSICTI